MQRYESFGECVKRCLKEAGLSASEAARLVGFRSRNSMFRILAGDAGDDIKLRFLSALHGALGNAWPQERWQALQRALSVERLGPERYEANLAFQQVLHEKEEPLQATVQLLKDGRTAGEYSLAQVLDRAAGMARAEIVITGCCDGALSLLLAERCGKAGDEGRVTIRQYIDVTESSLTQHILGILPLVSKPWYNARLVSPDSCPPEMMALYRLHALHICCWDEEGKQTGGMLIRMDRTHFATQWVVDGALAFMQVLDRLRFDLELLKPMPQLSDGPAAFVEYTNRYGQLEDSCTILSIKPDVHFNCIPPKVLYPAILEGFAQTGIAGGEELDALIEALWKIHEARYLNTTTKHKPTHLVYSLPAMERFMQTGVLTDQFFLQRAYTVEERREIIRVLLDAMHNQPWFNVHFFKPGAPALRYEISCYDGKGVMLMDAYTGYDLDADHSEALITLPAFMESFKGYFMDELLVHYVMSRADTLRELERLLVMKVQE